MMRSSSYAVFKIEFTAELTPLSEHALKPKYYVKVHSQSTQSCIHSLMKITHIDKNYLNYPLEATVNIATLNPK